VAGSSISAAGDRRSVAVVDLIARKLGATFEHFRLIPPITRDHPFAALKPGGAIPNSADLEEPKG